MPQTGPQTLPILFKEYLGKPRSKIFSFINAHTYSRPRCFSSSPGKKASAAGSGENTGNILYFNTSCPAPGQISADLSPLLGQADIKGRKITGSIWNSRPEMKPASFPDRRQTEHNIPEQPQYFRTTASGFRMTKMMRSRRVRCRHVCRANNTLSAILCSRNTLAEADLACRLCAMNMRRGILTIRFDLETGFYSLRQDRFPLPQ